MSLIRRAAVVAALSAAVIVPASATAQAAPRTPVGVVAHDSHGYGNGYGNGYNNGNNNGQRHYGLLTSLLLILL
ncbi:hypothetical protein ACFYM2_00615 [Streptomyces sp. NPDC006711]|uniref:hypothetical protein n=1 Tax=unclassified Streptomyces TaxID=2593676 RepID=UPI0033C8A885